MNKLNTHTLITGASSGIGKALAERFARKGHNLVLVSRDTERLTTQANQLREQYNVDAQVIATDLSRESAAKELFDKLEEKNLRIETLVNNAGFTVHGPFASSSLEKEASMLTLHLLTSMALVKLLVPGMKNLGGGKILNVSSLYAFTAVPHQAIYGATKSFLLSFSLALRDELATDGIFVCCLCPGITESEFRERAGIQAKDSKLSMSCEEVADVAYRELFRNKAVIVPGIINKLFVLLMSVLPASCHSPVTRWVTYTIRGFKQ